MPIGTLQFKDTATKDVAKIVRSLEAISPAHVLYFQGDAATTNGELVFSHSWTPFFCPSDARSTKHFFLAIVDGKRKEIRPKNDTFAVIKVVFVDRP